MNVNTMDVSGYELLAAVLHRAYDQAARGKGADRHANGKAFHEQPMQDLIELYGVGFALGQAAKKAQESQRMDKDAAVRELLGSIVYTAGAIIALEGKRKPAGNIFDEMKSPVPAIDPDFGKSFKEAMANGWLNWLPGIPYPTSDVEVEFRDGSRVKAKPYNLRWTWSEDHGAPGDIIRYRIIK